MKHESVIAVPACAGMTVRDPLSHEEIPRQARDDNKPALMALWKRCFPEDTDVFIDLYFTHLYTSEDVLIAVVDNQPIAFLQMLPCTLETQEKSYPTGYIYGVMTHPGYRHKGYMNQLLTTALSVLKERACDYAFLIPQSPELAHTYSKYGFVNCQSSIDNCQLSACIIPSATQFDVAKQDFINEGGVFTDENTLLSNNPGMLLRLNNEAPEISNWSAYAMLD
ncbi:MAG: GNAT family N-acetyltransferase [Candidatus Symbiothrix sp.]|jgi:predicted acetyltransferase|nr:GNAT family N-acetyltransferase [Candidatus Symbiothrix sp.]